MEILFENTIVKPYCINTVYVLEDNTTISKTQYFNEATNKNLVKIIWSKDEFYMVQEGKRQLAIPITLNDVIQDELPEDLYWDHP